MEKLNEKNIQEFLRNLVMERQVSTSYQNQVINAIKFYLITEIYTHVTSRGFESLKSPIGHLVM